MKDQPSVRVRGRGRPAEGKRPNLPTSRRSILQHCSGGAQARAPAVVSLSHGGWGAFTYPASVFQQVRSARAEQAGPLGAPVRRSQGTAACSMCSPSPRIYLVAAAHHRVVWVQDYHVLYPHPSLFLLSLMKERSNQIGSCGPVMGWTGHSSSLGRREKKLQEWSFPRVVAWFLSMSQGASSLFNRKSK